MTEVIDGERIVLPESAPHGAALSVHRLDVLLSIGRHAAERARLAGVARLRAQGPLLLSATPPLGDPYPWLARHGDPVLVALVGLCVAAGQIGLRATVDPAVARAACALHPGVACWLDHPAPSRPVPVAARRPAPTRPPLVLAG
ncbi:hypothetical protein [Marichromatium gracile]|uniref:hypothetical protein n=1 Tax=Marichromatium gracile TaxID=1048 RepID=UPI001290748F|nr:hypothetical protein [Marichromatium gracile]